MNFPSPPDPAAGLPVWASWCAEIGRLTGAFRVFPCWPREKFPLRKGWQTSASNDPLVVNAMWRQNPKANIGLAIQPGFIAMDGDIYKPAKEAALKAFEAKHGLLPDTLEFRSARGGLHLIYATDRRLGNSTGTLPSFGDVRGAGGLIVGPGSIFEGLSYTVERVAAPAPLPAAIDACLIEHRTVAPLEKRELPQFVTLDDPRNVERFIAWLTLTAKVSIEGQGGNNALAATGAMGASYALSWDLTLACMVEQWNPRCEPPWELEDLERHGGSGYRSASSAFGNMANPDPTQMFPGPAPDQPYTGWGAPVVTLDDLLAHGPPPSRQWALGDDNDGWMPLNDLTLLYGPGGVGKTTLVGQMARSFATHTALFGTIPARPMQVLYIGCEDDLDEMHRRFVAQGQAVPNVRLVSLIGHDTALHPPFRFGLIPDDAPDTPFYQFLEHHLAAMGDGDKMLFLDNLGQMYFGDYNDRGQIAVFQNRYVRRLLLTHKATGCILAHPSAGQVQSGEGSAGSPAWSANVRSHLYFDWVRDGRNGESGRPIGDTRVLSRKKSNYSRVHPPGGGVFLERNANWTFTLASKPPPPETPKAKAVREAKAEDTAVLFVVRGAISKLLQAFPGRQWKSDNALALDLAGEMVRDGNAITERTLRRHLGTIRASGDPNYHVIGGWCHKPAD